MTEKYIPPTHCRECGKPLTDQDNLEPDICNACYALIPLPDDILMPDDDEFKQLLQAARDKKRAKLMIEIEAIDGLAKGMISRAKAQEANEIARREELGALAAIGRYILGYVDD